MKKCHASTALPSEKPVSALGYTDNSMQVTKGLSCQHLLATYLQTSDHNNK